ncbi:MAG: deoxyribodipyrimidine photo-lyase [Actinomycetota bacterium]|nr:deoxyribodipyrimidine photo-lyase [Actinomycetota bacterium]
MAESAEFRFEESFASDHEVDIIANTDMTGIVWFRRDLRLKANPAWAEATRTHKEIVGLFVIDPRVMSVAGPLRQAVLVHHLHSLDAAMREYGGRLTIVTADAKGGPEAVATVVREVVADTEAVAVYANRDAAPYASRRDDFVRRTLPVPLVVHEGNTVHPPGQILTRKGTLSRVFSPYYNAWAKAPLLPVGAAGNGRVVTSGLTEGLPTRNAEHAPDWLTDVGPDAASRRLTSWLERVDDYPTTRDLPAVAGTSRLSIDLKFGSLSPQTVVEVVNGSGSSIARQSFVRQLAWRDWWFHLLLDQPSLPSRAIRPAYDRVQWRNDPREFDAWRDGRTGFPIVDAGMRQLAETGLMHNRVRMITGSFLVKDLLIDWRWGERHFRRLLLDADLAQNVGNWQWVAGTGPDAAPYFRIFNPLVQAITFDPEGDYVRRWVPELAGIPARAIHQPMSLGPPELASFGVVIGENYPAPIVDHAEARQHTLVAYRRALD